MFNGTRVVDVAESFFHTLMTQLIHHDQFKTYEEADRILFKYIEMYYNQSKKQSANSLKIPGLCELESYKF